MGESSKASKQKLYGNWRKGDTCYVMAGTLVIVTPVVMWKVEHAPNELGDLAKEISR